MKIPFTPEQFFAVFAQYNLAVWPIQLLFYALALTGLVLAAKETRYSNRVVSVILACLWFWMGLVYHIRYFSTINPAAYVFGGLFILQAGFFLWVGVLTQKLWFRFHPNSYAIVGTFFILYGLVIYPIWGHLSGHRYPFSPTFGLPCPTTIFTLGLLLWTDRKFPKFLLVIPVMWAVIGFFATFQLNVWEDSMLLVTGLVAFVMIWYRDMREAELSVFPLG